MRTILLITLTTVLTFCAISGYAFTGTYHVSSQDIFKGYIVEKIWLDNYAKPEVAISDMQYVAGVKLPDDALPSSPASFRVIMGKDRKRPFACIQIPVYTGDPVTKQINQLSDFTLTITEAPAPAAGEEKSAARTTGAANSVLANGTWYKIATTQTGLYKIDHDFIASKLGVDPTSINMANIRVFGNGGNMLSEDNSVARKSDLVENAIYVNDNNGNNKLDADDYIVFYSVGTTAWFKDSLNQQFVHQNNLYSDTAYYFIAFNQGAGLRIQPQGAAPAATVTVNSFNDYAVHDTDLYNPGFIGKTWYGEQFSENPGYPTSRSFMFNFGSNVTSLKAKIQFANISSSTGNIFNVTVNGTAAGSQTYYVTPTDSDPITELSPLTFTLPLSATSANVGISYTPGNSAAVGYLNYIELNLRRALAISGSQLGFRDWQSVGPGSVANYQLQGANGSTQVWDITNPQVPVQMTGSLSGSTYSYSQDAQILHEFVAMNNSSLYTPSFAGNVPNQNLHGSGPVDYIVVAYPSFEDAAQQFANYHQQTNGYRVLVATTTQIYNEFSSGAQDISAIRDFARMFYDRAGTDTTQLPRYLLLFGGASYDYKNRVPNNCDFVPTFESALSHDLINSYCTDDFFGFLDDNEYIENTSIINTLDIGVGRIPARNVNDALGSFQKITVYKSPASLGPWRLSTTICADNTDGAGDHMGDAEYMAGTVASISDNLYNQTKVYIDAIPTISTPAGARCPNANAAIDDQVFKGTFLINYNGHGNTEVFADERILTEDDYNSWANGNTLPFAVTATCDFGQFDQPQFVSAGEQLVMRNNAGIIAGLITTKAVYQGPNRAINSQYLAAQFKRQANGGWYTFGDACREGKNVTYTISTDNFTLINFRKFSLLGDPGLTPDFPENNIVIDSIKDGITGVAADSVKALGSYIISGSVVDNGSSLMSTFNGGLYITFYDKPSTEQTVTLPTRTFSVQNNIIYKGKATVTNGRFSFAFIAPKDLNYSYGNGKMSLYANDSITDAAGTDTSVTVGGFSDNPVISTNPPVVKPYINDSLFISGGITGNNTVLYAVLTDETGINVSGNVVGHDLTAVLDGDVTQPYVLNDYYETAPNTYQKGYVTFPVNGLADGRHSITVRAWDVNNNEGEGSIDFVVVDGKVAEINSLMNYPNPFKDVTHFVFEHNHPNEQIDAQILIYNTAGALVKNIQQTFTPEGSRTAELTWDGTTDAGAKLPSGMYVYRLNITTQSGVKTSAYQKLVLVR